MKKTNSTLLFLIFLISYSYGQKAIDIEIYGAPVHSYRFYKSQDYNDTDLIYPIKGKDYFDQEFITQTNNLEKPITGYLFGIKASHNLTDKISWQTGLEYSTIGEKADFGLKPLYKMVDFNGTQTYMPSTENYQLVMTYKYDYLSIPVSFKYKILTLKKIDITPCIGFNFDFLLDKNVDNTSEINKISVASKFDSQDHRFNTFSSAINIGLEFNYSLTNKLEIYMFPNYKQYFTPNERFDAEYHIVGGETFVLDKINKYNYLLGMNFGLRLRNIMTK